MNPMAITETTGQALANAINDAVKEAVAGTPVHADDVDGLEDAVCDILRDNHEVVDADDVSGLNDAIDSRIQDMVRGEVDEQLSGLDLKDRLDDAITDRVDEAVADKLPDAIAAALKEREVDARDVAIAMLRAPEVQEALQQEVRKALLAMLGGAIAAALPVAVPVAPTVS